MTSYWRDHPPLHLLVANALGIKSTAPPAVVDNSDPGPVAEFVPSERLSNDEFDALLRAEGIPLQ